MNIGTISSIMYLSLLFDLSNQAKISSNKSKDYYLQLVINALIITVIISFY